MYTLKQTSDWRTLPAQCRSVEGMIQQVNCQPTLPTYVCICKHSTSRVCARFHRGQVEKSEIPSVAACSVSVWESWYSRHRSGIRKMHIFLLLIASMSRGSQNREVARMKPTRLMHLRALPSPLPPSISLLLASCPRPDSTAPLYYP